MQSAVKQACSVATCATAVRWWVWLQADEASLGALDLLGLAASCDELVESLAVSQPSLSMEACGPVPGFGEACQAWAEQEATVQLAILPELAGAACTAPATVFEVSAVGQLHLRATLRAELCLQSVHPSLRDTKLAL